MSPTSGAKATWGLLSGIRSTEDKLVHLYYHVTLPMPHEHDTNN